MPSTNPAPSNLLTAAARDHLRPLGLFQKGKSRIWLDDHGWWLCIVEFQPGRSPGSYLNVGCMWLWLEKSHLSFDEGYRIERHTKFREPAQFAKEATRLATRAAEEVQRYQKLFPNVESVCEFYLRKNSLNPGDWQAFHAGVASAMSGKAAEADRFFDRFLAERDNRPDWLVAAQADAERLKALAGNTFEFRELVAERVKQTRKLLKL